MINTLDQLIILAISQACHHVHDKNDQHSGPADHPADVDHPPHHHQASSLQSPEEELDTELVWAQLLSSREQVGHGHRGLRGQPDHPHHVSHLVLLDHHVQIPSSWKQVAITIVILIAYWS